MRRLQIKIKEINCKERSEEVLCRSMTIKEFLKQFDSNAEGFQFTVKGSDSEVRTICGALTQILSLVILVSYAATKYNVMMNYGDTNVMVSRRDYFYDNSVSRSDELGFNVAFGLSDFDGSEKFIEDPDYGTLKAKLRMWGLEDVYGTVVEDLKFRRCNASDFYFDQDLNYVGETSLIELTEEQSDNSSAPFFFPPEPE